MIALLAAVSVGLALAIVGVVAIYLILIFIALKRAGDHLEALAGGLVRVQEDTGPLEDKVGTINGGLAGLAPPLLAVNGNLAAIVEVAARGARG
jgi:hypothetical protein